MIEYDSEGSTPWEGFWGGIKGVGRRWVKKKKSPDVHKEEKVLWVGGEMCARLERVGGGIK